MWRTPKKHAVSTIFAVFFCLFFGVCTGTYQVGVGRADCTGPSAEIVFMGYAKGNQKGCGIHLRQFSRAFIFDDGTSRAVFVTVDACMMAHGVKKEVIDRLHNNYNLTAYTIDNVIISGTHTHGTPGGFLQDLMFDIPNLGFVKETWEALAAGITESIVRADKSMVEAKVYVNTAELLDANINRSPASYLYNPEEERKKYEYNTDKTLVQLRFDVASNNTPLGAINWYAVHGTSMNNTNCLVSSDNVGYASLLLEESVNTGYLTGEGPFVAAFASTNLGDVSPNLKGPMCINTGLPCDNVTSTCDGENKYCIAFGPGNDMFESTQIIGDRLYKKAKELIKATSLEVTGAIKFIHQFVYMPNQTAEIQADDGTIQTVKGCLPAMGYSFAAGTTDGPGEFDFKQASTTDNPFWNTVRDFIFPPTPEDTACHYPKPILIDTGRIEFPYEWQPKIVPTQLVMLGNFVMIAVPGEFTTMSGRRMRDAIKAQVIANGGSEDTTAVITGLSNVYTNYIATPEEYQLQRYEGASTIYGPHTLTIYLKLYKNLVSSVMQGKKVEAGPSPPDFGLNLLTLNTPVLFDTAGWFNNFGDVLVHPPATAKIGDTVSVTFVSGHPRNDVMHDKTFLTVEKEGTDGEWTVVANDADWNTKFIWKRTNFIKGTSTAEIQWTIPDNTEPGTYRISHFGNYKYILSGGIYPYSGTSSPFTVTAASKEYSGFLSGKGKHVLPFFHK